VRPSSWSGDWRPSFGTLPALSRLRQLGARKARSRCGWRATSSTCSGNPSFIALFVSLLLLFTGLGVVSSLTLHANTFFWRLPSPSSWPFCCAIRLACF